MKRKLSNDKKISLKDLPIWQDKSVNELYKNRQAIDCLRQDTLPKNQDLIN